MGCSNSTNDPEIRTLSQKINQAIQSKSTLQYQISQLKFLQEAKKAYPDVKEVKDAQIQNLKLSKEIKDTENLLLLIKGNEMQNEDIKALEETYQKLKSMLDDRDEEIKVLEQEVQNEAKALEEHQDNLSRLAEESENVRGQLDILMQSEKYKTIKGLEEQIEKLESLLEQKSNELKNGNTFEEQDGRSPRRASITKVHQQLIMEIKKKVELEETLKEIRLKADNQKESYLGEELRNELARLDNEERELIKQIEEAEDKKRQLEKNRELEYRRSPYERNEDFDNLESRFDSSISTLLSGVGDIRSEKEMINEQNRKLKMEIGSIRSAVSPK
jgi:chromosome segregation ATPase